MCGDDAGAMRVTPVGLAYSRRGRKPEPTLVDADAPHQIPHMHIHVQYGLQFTV